MVTTVESTCFDQPKAVCASPNTPFDYAYPNKASIFFPSLGSNFNLQLTKFSLPQLSLPVVKRFTPLVDDNVPGDKMIFDDFTCEFLVSQDYSNYLTIFKWLVGLGKPRDLLQYKNKPFHRMDFVLIARDNYQRPLLTVNFQQAFPVSLGGINYDFSSTNIAPISIPVSFAYTEFEIIEDSVSVT